MWNKLALLVAFALLIGCGSGSGGNGSGDAKYRIAVIPKGTTHDFWLSVHYGAEQAAGELSGVEVIWKGTLTETDKEGQIRTVEGFVVDRVDGICLAPIDRDALVPVVARAAKRDIPTVIFDSGLNAEGLYHSYVATDNRNGGRMAGEHLAKLLGGKGGVILLRYQAGSESTEQREEGFLEALAEYPDIEIVSDEQRVSSDAEDAKQKSLSLLQQHAGKVDGVFTVCEPNNKGMLEALKARDLAGQIKFVAFDSDPLIVEGLREGHVHGVVLQDPVRMGYEAVKTMVAHLQGKPVEERIVTGEYLATPENMDEPRMKELLHPKKYGIDD